MFPVILPLFRTPFCSLHCQQFLHFSPHVLYSFLHSFLRACSEQSHLIFHVFTFCHVSPCNFLFLLQRTPQRIIRNINLHVPYLFFHLLQTEFQPFLALSPAKGVCFLGLLSGWSLANWRLFIQPDSHSLLQALAGWITTCYDLLQQGCFLSFWWVNQQGLFSI